MKTTLAAILLTATCAALPGQDERLLISGYGNGHYMDHDGLPRLVGEKDPNDFFFQLREFSLFLDYAYSDEITISTEIEAGDNGSRLTANYAYIDFRPGENIGIRAGKILVPFLSYNENKPNYKQFLMSQPFTAWQLAPVNGTPLVVHGFGWTDAGVTVNLQTEAEGFGIFDLKVSVINGLGSDSNILDDNTVQFADGGMQPIVRPRDGLIGNREAAEVRDNNSHIATVAKLSFAAENIPLDLGVSFYSGTWDPDDKKDLTMLGVHARYLDDFWTFKGEYAYARVEQDAGIDPGGPGINISTGDYDMRAWYLEASVVPFRWRVDDEDEDRFVRFIARYDEVDTNNKAAFTPFDRQRFTVGTEYQFRPNARIRFEAQMHTIHSFYNAPVPYRNAGGDREIFMTMASVIFWF